ncbi:MAG: MarR family transcriptional regulator, partial [Succinivibrio dextrinosolvens]|nr:MarR family transcriptional regulator [Succinivibrio dextrinosolvens]
MTKKDKNDPLLLENQVCFPLYACARRVVNTYASLLKELDLTYTQYVTMMVMWEHEKISVKDLGAKLYLDSGTLTPVLKKLCALGVIRKYRDESDERVVIAEITEEGRKLREKALVIPQQIC